MNSFNQVPLYRLGSLQSHQSIAHATFVVNSGSVKYKKLGKVKAKKALLAKMSTVQQIYTQSG